MNQPRSLLQKRDVIVLGILLFAAILALLLIRPGSGGAAVAVISYQGEPVLELDLEKAEDGQFSLEQNAQIHFEIENHRIRFVNANCPDKICEKNGFLSQPNQISVCLPYQTVLHIVGRHNELDAVVG